MSKLIKKQSGFTLIELMIVVLIAALVMLVASPFTSAWSASANIVEAEGVLSQAISRAKAAAQRNANGVAGNAVAAAVCGASGTVTVKAAASASTGADCGANGTQIWSASLPANITLKEINVDLTDGSNFAGLYFDSSGLVASSSSSQGNLRLKAGALDEQDVQFY